MKNALAVIFLIVFSAILYTLTIRGVLGNPYINTVKTEYEGTSNPLELSPERGRFAHIMALGEYGRYDLNSALGELAYPDVGYHGGRFYSYFAPGISYMATPFYLLGKDYNLAQVFAFGFVSLMSILAIVFIFKIAREILKLPLWASIVAPIIFAFGSSAWGYGTTLYQHHLTVFFIMSGFYAAWRYGKPSRFSWVWGIFVWINYALAFSIDYPNAVLMLPVIVYFLINAFSVADSSKVIKINFRISFILTMIFFVLFTGAHLYHNKIYFGDWTKLSGELPSYKVLVENNFDPQDPHIDELLAGLGRGKKSAIGFFNEFRLARSFNTLLFASDRGLFVFAPIFILGLIGLISAFRKKISPELLILLAIVIANIFLYSSWGDPWGGWAYGPRYLILSMSVLSIFVAYFLSIGSHLLAKKIIAAPLFLYSSAIGLLGALTTNAVPPSVEAIGLGVNVKSNFLYNIPLLRDGMSSSFIFKTYLSDKILLVDYFSWILSAVFLVFLFLIFVMPRFEEEA